MVTAQEAARQYAKHGWATVPLNPNTKVLAAQGFTGRHEAVMTDGDWTRYADAPNHPPGAGGWNIALRLPDGVIALDVDAYHDGEATMQRLVTELGGLPETVISSGRQQGGHLFYRVPLGSRLANSAGPGVDVLQHHHRYSVVWPSVVDDRVFAPDMSIQDESGQQHDVVVSGARREYRFRLPERMLGANGVLPPARELPELPAKWLEHLSRDASAEREHAVDVGPFLSAVEARDGDLPACDEIERALADYRAALTDGTSRYDSMVAVSLRVCLLAAEGHPGLWGAMADVEASYAEALAGEARDTSAEFSRAAQGAYEIAAARPFVPADPCRVAALPEVPGGAQPDLEFLPLPGPAWTDRHVAASALVFAARWMRSTDSGAWLAWAGDRWRWHYCVGAEGAEGAVSTAVAFIKPGIDDAEGLEGARSKLYKRMNGTGSAGVYTQARKLYRSEAMPLPHLRTDDLDSDPEQLWAGGLCWDLRASVDGPVLAEVDPGTVHTHSAGQLPPEVRPTPLWDAFLAAVWPDPEFRAWALRVLGITITGYADRALPILYGPPGSGKTSVASLLGKIIGTYYVAADPRLLSARDVHASVVLALKGTRVAFIDEAPRDTFSVTERLKMLTGGGQLTGNRMRGNPETFWPTHSLILTSNDEPRVGDPAVRSRVRPLECSGDPEEVTLTRRALHGPQWLAEVPGVLASLMAEAGRWLDDPGSGGNRESELAVLDQLALEADPVALWTSSETVSTPETWTDGRDLWSAYATWCAVNGIGGRDGMGNAVTFGRRLSQLLGRDGKRKRGGYWAYNLRVRGGSEPAIIPSTPVDLPPGYPTEPTAGEDEAAGKMPGKMADTTFPNAKAHLTSGDAGLGKMGKIDVELNREHQSSYIEEGEGPSTPGWAAMSEVSSPSSPAPVSAVSEPAAEAEQAPAADPKAEAKATKAAEKRAMAEAALEAERATWPALPALVTREPLQAMPLDVTMAAQLAATWSGGSVTLDVEHSGYPIGHLDYRLKTIQLGDANLVLVLDAGQQDQVELAHRVLDAASEIVAHSAVADVIPVAELLGISPDPWWAKVTDTAVLAWLENPEDVTKFVSRPAWDLKGLGAYVIPRRTGQDPVAQASDKARAALFRSRKWISDVGPTTPVSRNGWAQVEVNNPTQVVYAGADVLDTAALRLVLQQPDQSLLARERHTQAVVAKVAEVGLALDPDYTMERLSEHQDKLREQAAKLAERGLSDPASNPKTAAVLTDAGYDLPRSEKGNPSVAADVLKALPPSELLAELLEWRAVDQVLKTYLKPYAAQIQRGDGRVRPTVQTLGAATTGRMSCVRPNLQNVPREGGIRGCVVADPGWTFISADFSSVEIRVAAGLSGDGNLQRMIAEGLDVHKLVAQTVWGPDATKANRYQAKRGVFAWLYGGGKPTIAAALGNNHAAVDQVLSALTQLAPGLVRWSASVREQVKSQRMPYWRHPSGRITHLPHTQPHKASNLCIQSTARELLVDALLKWDAGQWRGHQILPIHDEIVALVPAAEADAALAYLVECMTSSLAGVAIVAEASEPSTRWQDSV